MTLALSIDLGQTDNFAVQQNKTLCQNSRIVGIISDIQKSNNLPFYLKSRPNNNTFSVKILDGNTMYSNNSYDYVLTLHLEKL